MNHSLLAGQIVVGLLWIAALHSYGVSLAATGSRELSDPKLLTLSRDERRAMHRLWWRAVNKKALLRDVRLLTIPWNVRAGRGNAEPLADTLL